MSDFALTFLIMSSINSTVIIIKESSEKHHDCDYELFNESQRPPAQSLRGSEMLLS